MFAGPKNRKNFPAPARCRKGCPDHFTPILGAFLFLGSLPLWMSCYSTGLLRHPKNRGRWCGFFTALFFFWFPPPAHFNPCFRLWIFLVCCFVHCAPSLVGFIWGFWGFWQDLRFGFFFHSHYGRFSFLRAFCAFAVGPHLHTPKVCSLITPTHSVGVIRSIIFPNLSWALRSFVCLRVGNRKTRTLPQM